MLSENSGPMAHWRSKPVMDLTVMGLTPMLPSTKVPGVLVMPDLVSRQKSTAVPRSMTAVGNGVPRSMTGGGDGRGDGGGGAAGGG
eukprot:scaffold11032_cov51-Phaeocystis_antarctica.AAC.1